MTERPLIFSGSMVLALLSGAKSQTRRLVTRGTSLVDGGSISATLWGSLALDRAWVDPGPSPAGPYLKAWKVGDDTTHRIYPRIWVGDRLWVKERLRIGPTHPRLDGGEFMVVYDADGALHLDANWPWKRGWLPSIHMPRGLSRISLNVTSVRPERLQAITEADALVEGMSGLRRGVESHRGAFIRLWDDLNAQRAPWASDPWVWCI
ncbi:MAG: hypothetical protein EPN91_05085, partial [Salinibacterium sp.]